MFVGIPKEIKAYENRVAMIPAGVEAFVKAGHTVYIETNAGIGSGFSDEDYIEAGAEILLTPEEVFQKSDMIIKVKEPQPQEYSLFKEGQVLFTYLHLAPELGLTKALLDSKVIGIAYETVQIEDGSLPLLSPMSEIAGRMAIQTGATFLEKQHGGRGVLLGGVPGTPPAKVVIVGAGMVGINAAKIASGMGADVTVLDVNIDKLRYIDNIFGGKVKTLMSNSYNLREETKSADLLVGAVLIPGARAPKIITEEMVKGMKQGSVIVDVAIDQGGSIETIDKITTHANPVFEKYGVLHYSVANMPGAVARTSTFALTNVTLPYALKLANLGCKMAAMSDISVARGINVINGKLTSRTVAESLGLEYTPLNQELIHQ